MVYSKNIADQPVLDTSAAQGTYTGGSVINMIEDRAGNFTNDVAFRYIDSLGAEIASLTYAELRDQIVALGNKLILKELKGERVLLMYASGLDYIVAYFATLYCGAVAVPVFEPRVGAHLARLTGIIEDASPALLLTSESARERLAGDYFDGFAEKAGEIIITPAIDGITPSCEQTHNSSGNSHGNDIQNKKTTLWQPMLIEYDDTVFLQYTSGSTGSPKGVEVTNANLITNLRQICQAFEIKPRSSVVSWLPLHHDMGLIGGVLASIYGACNCVLLSPVSVIQRPVRWLQAISRYEASVSGGPNFIYEACVKRIKENQLGGLDLSGWRIAFNGSEPLRASVLSSFADKFRDCGFSDGTHFPCYGLAESTLMVASSSPGAGVKTGVIDEDKSRVTVSSGQPVVGTVVKIVDPSTKLECSENKVGEIWISGDSVARGYWNKEEETSETFKAKLVNDSNTHYLRSGDLGFIDRGELCVTGRIKEVIILFGKNHYPQDIENTICASDERLARSRVAVFSVTGNGPEKACAMVELKPLLLKQPTEALCDVIKNRVSEVNELSIHDIVFVKSNTLAVTSSGKLMRHAAKALYLKTKKTGDSMERLDSLAGRKE